jgi:hypothetical protein
MALIGNCDECLILVNLSSSAADNNFPSLIKQAALSPCSKFNPKKWVQKQGAQWVQVYPFGKPDDVVETATAGATSAANVGVGAVYKNKPPKQPKNKDGTAKNALDMDANLMTGGSIKR